MLIKSQIISNAVKKLKSQRTIDFARMQYNRTTIMYGMKMSFRLSVEKRSCKCIVHRSNTCERRDHAQQIKIMVPAAVVTTIRSGTNRTRQETMYPLRFFRMQDLEIRRVQIPTTTIPQNQSSQIRGQECNNELLTQAAADNIALTTPS